MTPLALPGQLTETGLVLPEKLPLKEWAATLEQLGRLGRGAPWAIGDALVYGEDHYGEMFAQYVHVLGYAEQSLLNFAYTARHVGRPIRRGLPLTFAHHAEVASIREPERQADWLERAAKEGWTSKELREQIRGNGEARPSLGEVGDALCSACLALLRELPTGAGSDLLRDAAWQAVDQWLERRGKAVTHAH